MTGKLENYVNRAIPYAWDDSESWVEFLGKVVQKVNELVELSNDYFGQDLPEHIEQVLNEWYDSGKLAHIVESKIVDTIDAIDALDARVDQIITTPAESVSAQEIIDARDGTATLGARLDGLTNGTGIADGAITFNKTNFVTSSKNLFNKETIMTGYIVNHVYGNIQEYDAFWLSDYIQVEEAESYIFNKKVDLRVGFYDAYKNFISGELNPELPVETPSNTRFLRFSIRNTVKAETVQLEKGTVSTSYEPFGIKIPDLMLDTIKATDLEDNSIPPEKTTFASISKNLFNKETITTGYIVNQDSGTIQEYASFWLSDYIQVEEAESYIINKTSLLRIKTLSCAATVLE